MEHLMKIAQITDVLTGGGSQDFADEVRRKGI
jgi:hypothetical protein